MHFYSLILTVLLVQTKTKANLAKRCSKSTQFLVFFCQVTACNFELGSYLPILWVPVLDTRPHKCICQTAGPVFCTYEFASAFLTDAPPRSKSWSLVLQ